MKLLFVIFGILAATCCVTAQVNFEGMESFVSGPDLETVTTLGDDVLARSSEEMPAGAAKIVNTENSTVYSRDDTEPAKSWHIPFGSEKESYFGGASLDAGAGRRTFDRVPDTARDDDASKDNGKPRFHWKPALEQSMIFLGIQHGFRMMQPKTTDELGGKFFKDWMKSIKNMRGWRDGDNTFTNYVAHPLQGSVTGRIYVNNSDFAKKQEFGMSRDYWTSRGRAMLWSAFWSTQFEIGPISEASLGNVGLRDKNGYCTMAHVDLVVTPVVGTGVLVGEDAIDKYVLKNWIERGDASKVKIKVLRSLLTPTMSFTNLLRGKVPWKRDARPL